MTAALGEAADGMALLDGMHLPDGIALLDGISLSTIRVTSIFLPECC